MRSMVASAAIETVTSLFVNLKRDMDNEVEAMGSALLVRAANTSQNASLLESLSMSLRAMVENCSPPRVLTVLFNIGLSHLSSPVRAVTALQLHLLADRLGAAAALKAGQRFTSRFLIAVSKMLMDATAPVRAHGHAILKELAKQKDFIKLWKQYVPEKDQRFLEKTVTNAVRAAC
ncbi:TOG array regulator of axonemal microtubules protein 2-like [Menidia menidia]